MGERLINDIDELVGAIYKVEQKQIDAKFIQMLDGLDAYIKAHQQSGWDALLMELQTAYVNKNYVQFADILLYDLKPLIEM